MHTLLYYIEVVLVYIGENRYVNPEIIGEYTIRIASKKICSRIETV